MFIFTQIAKPISQFMSVLYIALSVGLYIQGNFLDFNLGALDGHEILWESFTIPFWIELTIWAVIIGLAFILNRLVYENVKSIFIILIVIQLFSGIIGLISNPKVDSSQRVYLDESKEFDFSNSENVIIIVLDTFRSDVFNEILIANPEYYDDFKDFVYFKNAIGGYPTTRLSVPLILSGEYYDNSIPIEEFVTETQEKILPVILKNKGFEVERYHLGYLYYGSVYDNNTTTAPLSYRLSTIKEQYTIAGIRYTPLLLKPFFVSQYYQGGESYHEDMIDFVNNVSKTRVMDSQSKFKFIHLTGAHSPYQIDNEFNFTDAGYVGQASASLKLVQELLDELKESGAYDNSLIFIIGDHGTQGGSLPESAQPLMLAKQMNQESEELTISDAPVTLGDIPKSIVEELNFDFSYPGYSVFDPIPSNRTRNWFYYVWEHSNWSSVYLPDMYDFEIQGPADQIDSYKLLRVLSNSSEVEIPIFSYQYGDNLIKTLLSDDVFRVSQALNFSYEETENNIISWAIGPKACVYLPVDPISNELTISFEAFPFLVDGKLDDQRMNVYVDGELISSFSKDSVLESMISKSLAEQFTEDKRIELCFQFPDSIKSPKDYGFNNDSRHLGYGFRSIVISISETD